MATSGTSTFDLDITEIAEEAFERCGLQLRTGYDLKTATRSLNLLTIEWANRGINFWTVEQVSTSLTADTATLTLPTDTIDIIEHWIRTGSGSTQNDEQLSRISVSQYSSLPNKNTSGRPVNIYIDKQRAAPVAYFWPTPDEAYTFVYQKLRRVQDVGHDGEYTMDAPFRFLPCMVAGLAYQLSMKYPQANNRMADLKAEYEFQWDLAQSEDRDRSSVRFVPGGYGSV
jgi:hypothetical protein|tara:strand:- start:2186 stop:2869 length:684 start_codon:yes stop_codon:yes gene_type:complete